MSERPTSSALLCWTQPPGLWRARQASLLLQRLGSGAPIMAQDWEPSTCDDEGFGPWHYWAHSARPMMHWTALRDHLNPALRDACAHDGSHPWHALALRGHHDALAAWQAQWGAPHSLALDRWRQSCLHLAVWSGNAACVAVVLPEQLDFLNAQDAQELTPLMIAVHRCPEMIPALLARGADPNLGDEQGRTALHHAALYGDYELLAPLEHAGGDMEAPDQHGQTADQVLTMRARRSERDQASFRAHWGRRYLSKLWF